MDCCTAGCCNWRGGRCVSQGLSSPAAFVLSKAMASVSCELQACLQVVTVPKHMWELWGSPEEQLMYLHNRWAATLRFSCLAPMSHSPPCVIRLTFRLAEEGVEL